MDNDTQTAEPQADSQQQPAPTPDAPQADIDHRARRQAAERRIALEKAEAELAKARAELKDEKSQKRAMLEAAGIDTDTSAEDALKKAEQQRKASEERAEVDRRAKLAEFKLLSLDRIDPTAAEDAFIIAESRGYLDAVTIEGTKVVGMEAALEEAIKNMPHFTKKAASGVDNHQPGSTKGFTIDLKNVQQGDITRLKRENPEEYDRLMDEGVEVSLGTVLDDHGMPKQERLMYRRGGSDAQRRIGQARRDWAKRQKAENQF